MMPYIILSKTILFRDIMLKHTEHRKVKEWISTKLRVMVTSEKGRKEIGSSRIQGTLKLMARV